MANQSKRIYLSPPQMSEDGFELAFVRDAFESNWIAPLGPHVNQFEQEFADYVGVPYAAALSSGTGALHLALINLAVGPGDEVLCSTFTFGASANAIAYTGAKPVFIDSNKETWNIDPELLSGEIRRRAKIGKLPKAVVAVDILGQCADWDPILEVCREYSIPLIEDAAEGLGSKYKGKKAGTFGDIAIFSFNGNKIMTTSGGGMLVSKDKGIVDTTRFLATQARDPAPYYQHTRIGYNYRMSNILAAIGRGQLKVLDEHIEKRRQNYSFYKEHLGNLPGLTFMPEPDGHFASRWLTCVIIEPKLFGATWCDVQKALEAANIETRPVWKPMHLQPVFSECQFVGNGVAEEIFEKGLCLPSGGDLGEMELDQICEIIAATCPAKISVSVSALKPDIEQLIPLSLPITGFVK